MPQLIPFYFVNQTVCVLILFIILLIAFYKLILPLFIRMYNIQNFIIKL